jgi:hypothetical protein
MFKKWKVDRIISVATLVTSVVALFLVLKKPSPVAQPLSPTQAIENAQSFQDKVQQLARPTEPGHAPAEIRLNSNEVTAAFAEAAGALPAAGTAVTTSSGALAPTASTTGSTSASSSPASADAALGEGQPEIKDQQVSFDGDVARGQFLTKIGGKDVYVTLAGKLGSKDGYATFDPTEFKVGDLNVPVSLVNDALQKRLMEQHDRLKLPDGVGAIKVENSELVLTQK